MSLSTTESPMTKVIFLQKIFRFAGRSLKDLVIINSVCKDFEETMQAHHTFNLVLYDNIVKKRHQENGFLNGSVVLLYTAPAWIVYQWTTVNEHDKTQREFLKSLLLYQAENGNNILIRNNIGGEDPSTTRELFLHTLDSCIKLGIAKQVLEGSRYSWWNCILLAISRKISVDCLALLIESCVRYGLDVKKMLEQKDHFAFNCIMLAVSSQCPFDSLKLLIDSCVQRGGDIKKILEHQDKRKWTCLSIASKNGLNIDSFRLLIAHFRSNESFRVTLAVKDTFQKCAVQYATTDEITAFLEDSDCWQKCCEWRKQQEVL